MSNVQGADQLRNRLEAIGSTRKFLGLVQFAAVAEAKKLVPRKTAFLQRSIDRGALSDSAAFVVAKAPYARYVEEGTGLYGPKKRKIVPKRAKVLAWRTAPSGGSLRLSGRSRVQGGRQTAGWAFAQSVRGRKATPYLLPGAQTAVRKAGAESIIKVWNDAA